MIEEKAIDTAEEFIDLLNDLPNHFVFSRQSYANWKLESTLERIIGKRWNAQVATIFEERSIKEFQSKYHIYKQNEHQPKSNIS
jgi:hypothetical protein